MDKEKGWKTNVAAYLTGAYAVIGMALYFLGGPDVTGAIAPTVGVPLFLGSFGLFGLRDAIAKLLSK